MKDILALIALDKRYNHKLLPPSAVIRDIDFDNLRRAFVYVVEKLDACRGTRYFNPVTDEWQTSVVQNTCQEALLQARKILEDKDEKVST